MKIGYIRVSTVKQATEGSSLETQEEALRAAGCERLYIDRGKSGASVDRPELTSMRASLREGDEVIVTKLDRFGRNLRDTLALIDEFTSAGVGFSSLGEGIKTDSSPTGKLMLNIFASFAEFERDRIAERTAEGIAQARKAGKRFGRPEAERDAQIQRLNEIEFKYPRMTVSEKAKQLEVSVATYHRIRRAREALASVSAA